MMQTMPAQSEFALYQTEDGRVSIQARIHDETVWLTLTQMALLFQVDKSGISRHLRNIYQTGELVREATVANFATVQDEGGREVNRQIEYYNLDAIISVGYRVNSIRGTQFRIWATQRLREYIVKGFTLDDERLKGNNRRTDYFDELLARIRDIRASEARAYQRMREIFALATDYVEGIETTRLFFATMQNKMHYAATGLTAAELIVRRADANKPNMGLTSWKGGHVRKADVGTAKNYLDAKEIDTLNRIVVMFLDQAEFRAQRRQDIHMDDWRYYLDKFLKDNELPVLDTPGSVSREQAEAFASTQYDTFALQRRTEAEEQAEKRYLDDLRQTARLLTKKHS